MTVIQRIIAMVGKTSPGVLKNINPWLSGCAIGSQVTVAAGLVAIPGEDRPHLVKPIECADDSGLPCSAVAPWGKRCRLHLLFGYRDLAEATGHLYEVLACSPLIVGIFAKSP